MTVVRVVKDKNFITMGKYHLKEKDMSLKAIGLLSIMLSLPEDWDYSVNGLAAIRKESRNTINEILNELEEFGYLTRTRIRDSKGKLQEIEYVIYESPNLKNRDMENQDLDNWEQLNNKELNNLNNKKENIKERFKKPTLEEVEAYVKERNSSVNPKVFFDYYEVNDWKDIKNWKQKLITWETHQRSNKQEPKETLPNWFNKEPTKSEISEEEEKEFQELLNSFS